MPTFKQLREDLILIAKRWKIIRTYGSIEVAPTVCRGIQAKELDLKVMVEVWPEGEIERSATGKVKSVSTAVRITRE